MGCGTSTNSRNAFRDAYVLEQKLGEGAHGVVHVCRYKETNRLYAAKLMEVVPNKSDADREASMMRRFNHPNVIKLRNKFKDRWFDYLIMDRYDAGDLVDVVQAHLANGTIKDSSLAALFRQMLSGINHLHENKVLHRDVKADNFLLDRFDIFDPDCQCVLSDLGTAVENSSNKLLSEQVGTKIYWSPEVVRRKYSFPADIWALGIILYGIVNGKFPFRDERQIVNKTPDFRANKNLSTSAIDFLTVTLRKDSAERPTCEWLLRSHPWINQKRRISSATSSYELNPRGDLEMEDLHTPAVVDPATVSRRELFIKRMERDYARFVEVHAENERRYSDPISFNVDVNIKCASGHFSAEFQTKDIDNGIVHMWQWRPLEMLGKQVAPRHYCKEKTWQLKHAWSPKKLEEMFVTYGVDRSLFGPKFLSNIAKEVVRGECTFAEDAEKKLVRLVEVVLVRVVNSSKRTLVETQLHLPEGGFRETGRLPGTKKRPHESVRQAAERVLSDYLRIDPHAITIGHTEERSEDEHESPAYPGLKTVYVKHFVDSTVKDSSDFLLQYGDHIDSPFELESLMQDTRQWAWWTQAQCDDHNLSLQGRCSVAGALSQHMRKTVVDVTWTPCMVQEKLELHGVDTSEYGIGSGTTRSLEDFAREMNNGESWLMESLMRTIGCSGSVGSTKESVGRKSSDKGELLRVMDVVMLRIVDATGRLLIEHKSASPDGRVLFHNRLPGKKKRPQESIWRTAQRILDSYFPQIKDQVHVSVRREVEEEVKESPSYPGLKCVYRKYFIDAEYAPNQMEKKLPYRHHVSNLTFRTRGGL
eukprot:GEMP01007115.1.p1 GENE.GEMP01007115.1~~GEMP01007115.1.p1  ORF type:complete len:815 (+),score=194.31 GEMP01007115.1:119-2563(+)